MSSLELDDNFCSFLVVIFWNEKHSFMLKAENLQFSRKNPASCSTCGFNAWMLVLKMWIIKSRVLGIIQWLAEHEAKATHHPTACFRNCIVRSMIWSCEKSGKRESHFNLESPTQQLPSLSLSPRRGIFSIFNKSWEGLIWHEIRFEVTYWERCKYNLNRIGFNSKLTRIDHLIYKCVIFYF